MSSDSKTPRGFAGLESMVSPITVDKPNLVHGGRPAGTSPLPETTPTRPGKPTQSMAGLLIGLGFLALIGIIVVIAQATSPKDAIVRTSAELSPSTNYEPLPTKPVQVPEKTIFVLKGSDGSRLEVEAPADASAEQLNALGRSKWRPKEEIPFEEAPRVGNGLLLEDIQIRYCLSEEIRLGGWQLTVNSYDDASVVAYNAKVKDYNARCSHFKYQVGALERVRASVESRRVSLDADGRHHLGPRQPEKTPTYKLVSSRSSPK